MRAATFREERSRWTVAGRREWPVRIIAVAFLVAWGTVYLSAMRAYWPWELLGYDFGYYLTGARDWLATGSPYTPASLAGPMVLDAGTMPFLHPPLALPLFAAFTVLPAVLWWAIPLGVLAVALARWRPQGWTFYAIVACLAYPRSLEIVAVGNTDMWASACVAAGLALGWPAAALLAKPSALPFALIVGWRRRPFWVALVALAVVSLAFGSLWFQWVTVVRNVAGSAGYLFHAIPWMLLPFIAHRGRSQR